jgi:hypothetical protein
MVATVGVKALRVGGALLTLVNQVELIVHVLHCMLIQQVSFLWP